MTSMPSPHLSTTETTPTTRDDDHLTPVTSSSPTALTAASYHAMLAAVNSQKVPSLTQDNLIAAAAAAAAAIANGDTQGLQLPQQPQTATPPKSTSNHHHSRCKPIHELDAAKRDSIRAANRERKKKWRIHNEERNKDNDLRCRVNKRATKLYGPEDTKEKRQWAQEEFEKRREKRMEKERRKNIVDNVMSVPPDSPSSSSNGGVIPSSTATSSPQQQPSSPRQQAAAAVAAAVASSAEQLSFYPTSTSSTTPPPLVDPAAAAKMLDFPPDLQRQLLEQLNNMIAMTNAGRLSAAPDDLVHHQDQSQDPTLQPDTNVKIESDTSPSQQQQQQQEAATASSSTSGSECNSGQNTPVTIKQDAMDHDSEENHQEDVDDGDGKQEGKRPEYTMDAVLTLMQLNAGWRE